MSLLGKAIAAALLSTALVGVAATTFAAAPATKPSAATPVPTPAPKPPVTTAPAAPAPSTAKPAPAPLTSPSPPAASAAPVAPDISDARLALAKTVAKNAPTLGDFDGILPDLMVEAKMRLISQRPDLYKQISTVVEVQASALVVRRNDLDNDIARAWARAFTDDELKQINAFFASDVGKKYKAVAPQVGNDIITAGQNWADRVAGELYDRSLSELTKQGFVF